MFKVIEDAERRRIIDEALEGKRAVGDIARDAEINHKTLYVWLEEHYATHPDDPRRHLVLRDDTGKWAEIAPESREETAVARAEPEAMGEATMGQDVGAGDNTTREDMGSKKKPRHVRGENNPIRRKALELLKEGKLSQADIARQLHTSEGSVSFWKKQSLLQEVSKAEREKVKQAILADVKAGYTGESLVKRHKNKLGKSAIYRILAEFRAENEAKVEQKRAHLAVARETHQQRLRDDPEYRAQYSKKLRQGKQKGADESNGQLDLPVTPAESTQISRPAPSTRAPRSGPVAAIVEYRAEFPPDSRLMSDTLKEAIEERNTLRGMVTILQREAEALKKELETYKRTLGERR